MGIMAVLILVGLLFLILFKFNKASIKGHLGEKNISYRLSKLSKDKYLVLNNILIKNINGSTSQIDHIVISVYGLFVIETKNYKGWIFGHEKSDKWTQVIYNQKYFFVNPVKQNWSHVYALKSILSEYGDLRYIPIVVFSGSSVLKKITSNVPVIYDYELKNYIEEYPVERCISIDDVQKIAFVLGNAVINEKEKQKNHVENIHKSIIEKQLKKENLICPRCDAELKLRNGRNGKFYGCSNYPRCRYTMSYHIT